MSKAIFGKKLGMTQSWDKDSIVIPETVIKIETNIINRIKTDKSDGYTAVQIAYGNVKNPQKVSKPHKGQFGSRAIKKYLSEIRVKEPDEYKVGQELNADIFEVGSRVDVTGTTKGKGFSGVMKRHNFSGVSATHGAHLNHRKAGSIGACATPARVFKGLKMAGQMGVATRTIQNLKIIEIDKENGLIKISGAIPGNKYSIVKIMESKKQGKKV
jgi:large subunit ribosomal protein L3